MFKKHWSFLICLIVLLALLAKDPFSQRTLIPNFEPYPDSIHYITPARSLAAGEELTINREGRHIKPGVPPLYSLALVPFFMINSDPRFFYFANVFFALAGFSVLYLLLRKFTQNPLLLFLSLFLYATNYFIYWYPSLAMAENLTLLLFILNLYLLTVPVNKFTIVINSIVPFGFYLTKYANAPLTAIFLLAYAVKFYAEVKKLKDVVRKENIYWYLGSLAATLFVLLIAEVLPPVSVLTQLFAGIFPQGGKTTAQSTSGGWFSLSYMADHLPKYVRALFGGYRLRFLWDDTPIWPFYVGLPGLIGLFVSAFSKKIRFLPVVLLISIAVNTVFMSTFYAVDMRYLYYVITALLIGFVFFWEVLYGFLFDKCKIMNMKRVVKIPMKKELKALLVVNSVLAVIFLVYLFANGMRLKKQVMLNLKYAETPWYYISVLKLNEYFKDYPADKKAPVVISAMIPHYIDFYSNQKYSLLPLSLNQELRNFRREAWGDFDYSDLIMLYSKILYTGRDIYVHNYGIGNEKPLQDDFKKIQDNFILTKVADGCYGACNIWKLKIKYPLLKKLIPKK